jgi:hypothetical protein
LPCRRSPLRLIASLEASDLQRQQQLQASQLEVAVADMRGGEKMLIYSTR